MARLRLLHQLQPFRLWGYTCIRHSTDCRRPTGSAFLVVHVIGGWISCQPTCGVNSAIMRTGYSGTGTTVQTDYAFTTISGKNWSWWRGRRSDCILADRHVSSGLLELLTNTLAFLLPSCYTKFTQTDDHTIIGPSDFLCVELCSGPHSAPTLVALHHNSVTFPYRDSTFQYRRNSLCSRKIPPQLFKTIFFASQ